MKKFIYPAFYSLLSLLAALQLVACNAFLDPEPDGRKTESLIFSDYNYALGYFASLYAELPGGFHSMSDAMEACATDEAEHSLQTSAVQKYNDGSWNKQSFTDSWLYGKYYTALRKLAIFLENVDEARFIEPNTYNRNPELNVQYQQQYKNECYFLRAFYYFELVKRFGGVPIVPEDRRLELTDQLDLPRETYDRCVEYIIENCGLAANSLPEQYDDQSMMGHATKAAALALKCRVQLYYASPLNNPSNDTQRWKDAALSAKAILDMPQYGLMTGSTIESTKMFVVWNENYNKEVIFGMNYSNDNTLEKQNYPIGFLNAQGLTNPTQDLVDAFEMRDGRSIDASPDYDPQNPYANRDPRLEWFICYNGAQYGDRTIETYVGGLDGLNRDQTATKTGYYMKKFLNLTSDLVEDTKSARRQWIHFRYAEILLNYAEAMNEVYGPVAKTDGFTLSALEALNMVRQRSGMPAVSETIGQDEFRERVRNERRVELCFEGHRFWDVRRWKQGALFNQPIHGMRITRDGDAYRYETFEVEQRSFDESKMYLMPIPQDVMLKSPALEQNPGW